MPRYHLRVDNSRVNNSRVDSLRVDSDRGQAATRQAPLARAVTEVLSPVPVVAAMDLLLGWAGGHHRLSGLLFGALAVLITIVPPYAFVLLGVRRGRFTDHHLGDRRQRMLPLILGIIAMVAGVVALALAGAPHLLLAGIEITAAGLLAGAAVSRFWKMSGHTTAAAAVLVILAAVGHGWPLLATPLIAVIGWARVRLGDHTVAQVVVGALTGALIAALMIATPAW
jgi:membrane-associated phospholipid phosphatase